MSESPESQSTTYYWDFFGPHAAKTAAHFEEHLKQFLSTNALSGCETGLESAGAGHLAAFCRAPAAACPGIESALRPRRKK